MEVVPIPMGKVRGNADGGDEGLYWEEHLRGEIPYSVVENRKATGSFTVDGADARVEAESKAWDFVLVGRKKDRGAGKQGEISCG